MSGQKEHKWLPYVMVAPALLVMVLVVLFPILNTINQSFHTADGAWTFDNYTYFFTSDVAFQSFVFTIVESLLTTGLSLFFSFLLALYLRFSNSPVSRLIGRIYLLPRFIPGIAAVYAVMNIIKNGGFLNRFFLLFGINFQPNVLHDLKGIVLSNLWFSIPFCAMMMSAALSSVSDSYLESARDAGCGWWRILWRIIWPLTYKDLVVAGTFILMGQIGSFSIPYLTGPNNPKMLGILLYNQAATYMDYEHAAALSVLMFLLCLAGAIIYIRTNLKESEWQAK